MKHALGLWAVIVGCGGYQSSYPVASQLIYDILNDGWWVTLHLAIQSKVEILKSFCCFLDQNLFKRSSPHRLPSRVPSHALTCNIGNNRK